MGIGNCKRRGRLGRTRNKTWNLLGVFVLGSFVGLDGNNDLGEGECLVGCLAANGQNSEKKKKRSERWVFFHLLCLMLTKQNFFCDEKVNRGSLYRKRGKKRKKEDKGIFLSFRFQSVEQPTTNSYLILTSPQKQIILSIQRAY